MTIHDVAPVIRRDHNDRPYIIPLDGGKESTYMRVSTLAGTLDDRFKIEKWKQRQVALGLSYRPDLRALVASHRDDKDTLNQVCETAMEVAEANGRANLGTALHAFAASLDRGITVVGVPPEIQRDLDVYRQLTEQFEFAAIERFMVCDPIRCAGTPDRIVRLKDGTAVIADMKTGGSVDLGRGYIGIQLAVYAHSKWYDSATGVRTEVPGLDLTRGLVFHLAAGSGQMQIYWVNLERGWDAALTADWVRDYRTDRKLLTEATEFADARGVLLDSLIDLAMTPEELAGLWAEHRSDWLPSHTTRAAARKAAMLG